MTAEDALREIHLWATGIDSADTEGITPGDVLAAVRSPLVTRFRIAQAIEKEAPNVPLTMPFFLAAELLKECRRQNLKHFTDRGELHNLTIVLGDPKK